MKKRLRRAQKTSVLGLRFSNTDYRWVVMSGPKDAPHVVAAGRAKCPKGFSRPQTLKWLCQEIETLITRHSIDKIAIKKFEGMQRGNSYELRVEHEATAYVAAANHGLQAVFKKPKSTIAKDLGLKGKGSYLATKLDTSLIPNFSDLSDPEKDAVLVGWSELQ